MFIDPHRTARPALAGEPGGTYTTGTLTAAVDAQLAVALDELDETAIRAELSVIETATRRLHVRAGELANALVQRQAKRIKDANPKDVHAGDKAARQVTDELRDSLQWTPSKTKSRP